METSLSQLRGCESPIMRFRNNLTLPRPGACRYCKKLKMRCEFPRDANTCRRCMTGNHQCIVEGRKPRSGPKYVQPFSPPFSRSPARSKREYLLAQLRQKEAIIDSLLKQIHNPTHQTPLNLALPSQTSLTTTAHSTVSPEPAANKDVLAWIEKIQGASVRTAGGTGGANAFQLDTRAELEDPFHDDAEDDDGAGAGENETEQEAEADVEPSEENKNKSKLHSLPEEAAPLGLIANLALRNTSPRKPSMGVVNEEPSPAVAEAGSPEQAGENDNDVGVANVTYFLPGERGSPLLIYALLTWLQVPRPTLTSDELLSSVTCRPRFSCMGLSRQRTSRSCLRCACAIIETPDPYHAVCSFYDRLNVSSLLVRAESLTHRAPSRSSPSWTL